MSWTCKRTSPTWTIRPRAHPRRVVGGGSCDVLECRGMPTITPIQLDHMLHAVGRLRRNDRPRARAKKLSECYRNYFCSDEDASWEDLVAKGYAATGGDPVYSVTESGFALLIEARARLLSDLDAAKSKLRTFDGTR